MNSCCYPQSSKYWFRFFIIRFTLFLCASKWTNICVGRSFTFIFIEKGEASCSVPKQPVNNWRNNRTWASEFICTGEPTHVDSSGTSEHHKQKNEEIFQYQSHFRVRAVTQNSKNRMRNSPSITHGVLSLLDRNASKIAKLFFSLHISPARRSHTQVHTSNSRWTERLFAAVCNSVNCIQHRHHCSVRNSHAAPRVDRLRLGGNEF